MAFSVDVLVEHIKGAQATLSERDCFFVDDEPFGVRRFRSSTQIRKAASGVKPKIAFAEDDCGNYFLVCRTRGHVYFWNHETGECRIISDSIQAFLNGLRRSPTVELAAGQVIEKWIDPEFEKQIKKGK